jgi:alpha-pyrone synthase
VELSSLHLQEEQQIERLLMMLQFGDGAAAALITGDENGFAIERPFSLNLAGSADLIGWQIGNRGFIMHLSGEVPGRIQEALEDDELRRAIVGTTDVAAIDRWAVHAGGRSILDAVARGLQLPADALDASRGVLARFGNMSSATLMFILADLLADPASQSGVALAFGPGLAAEGFDFVRAD